MLNIFCYPEPGAGIGTGDGQDWTGSTTLLIIDDFYAVPFNGVVYPLRMRIYVTDQELPFFLKIIILFIILLRGEQVYFNDDNVTAVQFPDLRDQRTSGGLGVKTLFS